MSEHPPMLACGPVELQTQRLVTPGGLFERDAQLVVCETEGQLSKTFEQARRSGRKVTLVAGQRSFGGQFMPPGDALGVDVSGLGRGAARRLETCEDGSIWVRVGGGARFCDLRDSFPGFRVRFPPTSDRITLAGAIAACTHSSRGYLADDLRAMRLFTPRGEFLELSEASPGQELEIFRALPGAFGLLGVVTEVELRLYPIDPEQCFGVHALYAGPSQDGHYLNVLEQTADDPRFSEGAGGVVYGNLGHSIVFGQEPLPLSYEKKGGQALLTDDAIEEHAFTQGFANRFPRLAEWIVSRTYPHGIMRWAPWYGFQFFHRGFDRSYEVLGRSGLKFSLSRALGVDRRLPVYHQAWFLPRTELRPFLDVYFEVLGRYPGVERRGEQQDLVLLPPCKWPAHTMSETKYPLAALTSSYSVAGMKESERKRVSDFFREVSRETHQRIPDARVSLCKQIHCDADVLGSMHRPFVELIGPLKEQTDPQRLLTSEHWEQLSPGQNRV